MNDSWRRDGILGDEIMSAMNRLEIALKVAAERKMNADAWSKTEIEARNEAAKRTSELARAEDRVQDKSEECSALEEEEREAKEKRTRLAEELKAARKMLRMSSKAKMTAKKKAEMGAAVEAAEIAVLKAKNRAADQAILWETRMATAKQGEADAEKKLKKANAALRTATQDLKEVIFKWKKAHSELSEAEQKVSMLRKPGAFESPIVKKPDAKKMLQSQPRRRSRLLNP